MLAAVKTGPKPGLELRPADVPAIGPGEVLIKVRATSICGTDLHIYQWDDWAKARVNNLPLIQGHELFGEVVSIGSEANNLSIGDRVAAESHVVCGLCDLCQTGQAHLCRQTKILGVDRNGCFAEFVSIPAINARPVPDGLPVDVAVLMENFGNAVHAAETVDIMNRTVLITGCGPVGCMAAAVCRADQAEKIFASDISQYRLDLAEQMGAHQTILAQDDNLIRTIQKATGGLGVDVLIEMSGAIQAIQDGLSWVKPGGHMVLLGLPSRSLDINLSNQIIFTGLTIHGVVGRRLWQTWDRVTELLDSKSVDLKPIVTHRLKLSEIDQGFSIMKSKQSGKIVLYPDRT